jgi:transcriptional regulator with XRE-family HTH domain
MYRRRVDLKSIDLDYIKSRRTNLKITQQHMANMLGFKNASTYLKYEKGEYSFRAVHLPLIANELHCELKHLFSGERFADSANHNHLNG